MPARCSSRWASGCGQPVPARGFPIKPSGRHRAGGRWDDGGIARDDLVAYVAYRSGLELDGSTVARWESAQHRPRPAHIRAVVAALADLDAFAEPADAEAILQLAQADAGTAHGRLDLSQLTTVSGSRRTQPTIGVLLALEQGVVEASYVLAAPTTVLGRGARCRRVHRRAGGGAPSRRH